MKTNLKIQANIAVAFVSALTFVMLIGLTTATLHAQPGILRTDSLELICHDTPQIFVGYPSGFEVTSENEYESKCTVTIAIREWLKGPQDQKEIQLEIAGNKWDRAALQTWIVDQEEILFFVSDPKSPGYFNNVFRPLSGQDKNANVMRMLTSYRTTQRGLLAHTRQAIQSNRQIAADNEAAGDLNFANADKVSYPRIAFLLGGMFERRMPLDSRLSRAIKESLVIPAGRVEGLTAFAPFPPSVDLIEKLLLPECREHISDETLAEILNQIIKTESLKTQHPYVSRETEVSVEYEKVFPVIKKAVEALKSLAVEIDPATLPDTSTISIKKDKSELVTLRHLQETYIASCRYSMRETPWGNNYVETPRNDKIPELARIKSISFRAKKLIEHGLPDLSALSAVEAVEIKYLRTPIDLSPLSGLTALKHLDLIGSAPDLDFTPLAELNQLESLCLPGRLITTDLTAINSLRKLQRLEFCIEDLSVISNLTELKALHVNVGKQTDLSPLANLTKLQELTLSGDEIQDLSPLSKLTNLQQLTLTGKNVRELSALASLTKLQILTCWCPNLESIHGLEEMEQLTFLELVRTSVSDLSPLQNLHCLKKIDLDEAAQIEDISPLKNLTSLEELKINRTRVADLSPLATVTSLKGISAEQTPANDVSGLVDLENLQYLSLGKREKVIGAERLRFIDGLRLSFGLRDHPQYEKIRLDRKHLVDHAARVISPKMLERVRSAKSKEPAGFNLPATDPNYVNATTILRRVGAMKIVAVSRADLCSHAKLQGQTAEKNHELTKQENDFVATLVRKHSENVVGCFSVDPASPFALEETKRCIETEQFRFASLNLVSEKGKSPLAADNLKPILTACAQQKTSVLLHVDLTQVAATAESARSFCSRLVEDKNGLHCIVVPENVSPESLQNLFAAMAKIDPPADNAALIHCCVSGAWFDANQELVEQPDFKSWKPVAKAMRDIGLERFVIGSGLTDTHAWMFDRVLKDQLEFSFAEVREIRSRSMVQQ